MAYTTQAPTFTQGIAPWKPLQNYQKTLPSLFDTSGLTNSYNRQISDQYDMSKANAAAAMAQYVNRAQQSGASTLGAGFAGGQAMLGGFRAANQLRGDLASKVLQSNTAQAGIGSDLASRIGQLMSTRQGQLSDYQMNQQRLQQSGGQFDADLAFRRQQLAQQQSQFLADFGQHGMEYQNSLNSYRNSQQPSSNVGQYGQGQFSASLPKGVSSPGYITNSGPLQAATLNNGQGMNTLAYGTAPIGTAQYPGVISGYGTAAFGGGGKELTPGGNQASLQNLLKLLSGG